MMENYLSYLKLNMLNWMMMFLIVLMSIAFTTLLERKILGLVQGRKGPNKVGLMGIFQPFSDGMKLFNKEMFKVLKSEFYVYYICPVLLFIMMLVNWMMVPVFTNIYYLNYSLLMIIVMLSIMSYMFMLMGWSSNSIYSMVGSMRVVAQVLSYEVSFILIVLVLMILVESCSLISFMKWQENMWFMVILFPLFLVFFFSILAELNRSPMDFIEGESELISGFNIEYSSGSFALIMMGEYGMIIFLSYIMLFMFTNLKVGLYMSLWLNFMVSMIIFMRSLLPRMRYDELMYLCWKIILPFVLNYLFFILNFKYLISMLVYGKN